MALAELTRGAVLKALEEFRVKGRENFLGDYGFGPARSYFIEYEGESYDSKAVAGVAHQYVAHGWKPLTPADFSGGDATVAAKLRELGFVVTGSGDKSTSEPRNPPWTRDELILALELYMRRPESPPGKTSKEVAELSAILNQLGSRLDRTTDTKYRNANGVYMKMMNFRRFDPSVKESGRVGLTRGNKEEEVVWRDFANDPERLKVVAKAITSAVRVDEEWDQEMGPHDDGFCEAPEGRVLTRIHVIRERNRKLVQRKKASVLEREGRLVCEVCDFDFEAHYGARGRGFIEAHHTKPVHALEDGATTKLEDLALLCANCHRMIHASKPWLDLGQLRKLLVAAAQIRRHSN